MAHNLWSYWFSGASVETLKKVHDEVKNKSMSRSDALLRHMRQNELGVYFHKFCHVLGRPFIEGNVRYAIVTKRYLNGQNDQRFV